MQRSMRIAVTLILSLSVTPCYSVELKKPKAGLKKAKLSISNWSPPTSLDSYVSKGSNDNTDPLYRFNLNLGYLRLYTKSNSFLTDRYLINSDFPFIIEFKPFDFVSFLTSGSSYSIFVEKNEVFSNFTLILSNRSFSSTQYITDYFLWYGDFWANAIKFNVLFPSSVSPTSDSALETLYPTTRGIGIGFSERVHLYQSTEMALGLLFYFEFHIPKGEQDVLKNLSDLPPVGQAILGAFTPSSSFTYATMGGLFFRYKKAEVDFNSEILYQRRKGDFDAWAVDFRQNTVLAKSEISWSKQYFLHANYQLIAWTSGILIEEATAHIINIGGEIKGFGKSMHWLGLGFDFFYHNIKQNRNRFGAYNAKVEGISLIPSVSWFPLAFHNKNHLLRFHFLFGLFKFTQKGNGTPEPGITGSINESGDWKYSFMVRVTYEL
ncbi:MAG: hypothetical protein IEMM0008_0819 [bacterium]|nr:MAG: hypothetical protein IEMM0008_0819 [bacterium]